MHSRRFASLAAWFLVLLLTSSDVMAQQASVAGSSGVPKLINYSGVLTDANSKPLNSLTGVTFLLYRDQQGGPPLWMETQNVQPDRNGHYTVTLGATNNYEGLPADVFANGEARWLAVQVVGEAEQPRVLLVAVPYALKAKDAETIGGLPPSAFLLAAPLSNSASLAASANSPSATASALPPATSNVTTTGGTVNTVPLFTTATNIQNSAITQTGSGTTAKIGINTAAPATTLDVNGAATMRGILTSTTTGTATAAKGFNSQPQDFIASAFNSSTSTAVAQKFQWQAEPVGNDTSTPTGSLHLLFGSGTAAPVETGLTFASNGKITFAAGQTFPGSGTVTSVASGLGLTGGPITGSGTLAIDPTVVPQLAAANTFTGTQTVNGNLNATGVVSGAAFQIGGNPIAFGTLASQNALLGFSGNSTMTGQANAVVGAFALQSNTTGTQNAATGVSALNSNLKGNFNTANGFEALFSNTSGNNNTAIGQGALLHNTTGSGNTGLGDGADVGSGALQNATAIGQCAFVSASNSLVLGSAVGVGLCGLANTNVGIGTPAPAFPLQVERADFTSTGVQTRTINDSSTSNALAVFSAVASVASVNVEMLADGLGTSPLGRTGGVFGTFSDHPIGFITNNTERMRIAVDGNVGIGTTSPSFLLTVNGSAAKPGGGSWTTLSDRRLKTLDGTFNSGLSQILKINPVRYRYKEGNAMEVHDRDEHIGLVAQDVQKVIPEAVTENNQGYLLVNNDPIIWSMLNAIKQQQQEIAALRAQLRKAAAKHARLETRLSQLEHDQGKQARLASARR